MKPGEVLYKAIDGDNFALYIGETIAPEPLPPPPSTDTNPPEPQTIYPMHIVVPAIFLDYYLGLDDTNEHAAEMYYHNLVQDGSLPSTLTAGETGTWLKDDVRYAYLYFKDTNSCLK